MNYFQKLKITKNYVTIRNDSVGITSPLEVISKEQGLQKSIFMFFSQIL